MSEYANRLAGELSYGHQRRVEIMRALALVPTIADE
jgi:ABC-type branched-subunit amino acid transport system ATPase component